MQIALIGYGKMGKTIEKLALENGHEIVLTIDQDNPDDLHNGHLAKADVAIEFTRPVSAFENLKACILQGVPVVSGTTGWLDRRPDLEQLVFQHEGAFFYASNYSIGVNIFFRINQLLGKLANGYPEYHISMEEIHHTEKLDAPSGTAISLANDLIKVIDHKSAWVNATEHAENEIPIVSKRFPKVPGTHRVRIESKIDTIEISHEAYSRAGFAQGALRAAEWIIGKKGVFGMTDLLGF
ncbi:MAG: 4-hydroxy-tetrahydrodipicolinate reductase [Bacteroidota bacterium]